MSTSEPSFGKPAITMLMLEGLPMPTYVFGKPADVETLIQQAVDAVDGAHEDAWVYVDTPIANGARGVDRAETLIRVERIITCTRIPQLVADGYLASLGA